jgi:hypothetical protein
MLALLITPMFAAAAYSLIYLLLRGGLVGSRFDFYRGENVRQMGVVEYSSAPWPIVTT